MKYFKLYEIEKEFNALVLLIKSTSFLSGNYKSIIDIIIEHEEDAIVFATDQDVDYLKGIEYQYWTHILEDQDTTYYLLQSKNRFLDQGEFMTVFDDYYNQLNTILFERCKKLNFSKFLTDCLSAEFYNIFVSHLIFDELPDFSKRLLFVLEQGGFPCGWKGEFPEGKMIVYNHKSSV